MEKRKCDMCGTGDRDVGWTGTKICPHCSAFACSKCGNGKTKCPKCHKKY